jgi:hypothetical protein
MMASIIQQLIGGSLQLSRTPPAAITSPSSHRQKGRGRRRIARAGTAQHAA